MLTDQDIQKIIAVVATKHELADVREDTQVLREQMGLVLTSLDGIAKSIEDLKMEYVAIKLQLDRHDRWIKELAQKTGIELKD